MILNIAFHIGNKINKKKPRKRKFLSGLLILISYSISLQSARVFFMEGKRQKKVYTEYSFDREFKLRSYGMVYKNYKLIVNFFKLEKIAIILINIWTHRNQVLFKKKLFYFLFSSLLEKEGCFFFFDLKSVLILFRLIGFVLASSIKWSFPSIYLIFRCFLIFL